MTALPQLVAAFHSLVGLAAVFVAGAAFYAPEAYGIGVASDIKTSSLIEMSIGTAIGAITPPHSPGVVDVQVAQGVESVAAAAAFRYQVPFVRGDTNQDGLLNITDGVFILNYLFVPMTDTSCPDALDINDDNQIGTTDALMLLNYLFLGGPPPLPPFPDPGLDPTPDGPGCDL